MQVLEGQQRAVEVQGELLVTQQVVREGLEESRVAVGALRSDVVGGLAAMDERFVALAQQQEEYVKR